MVAFALLACSGGAGALAACSDTDPHYGSPDAIQGRTINYGTPGTMDTTPTTEGGAPATPKSAAAAFADLYATFAGTAAGSKCTPCHAAGGVGGKFFVATDAVSSRAFFLANGYQDITKPNTFATKGAHSGPALLAAQVTLTKTWSDAEKTAGTMTMTTADAGAVDAGTD